MRQLSIPRSIKAVVATNRYPFGGLALLLHLPVPLLRPKFWLILLASLVHMSPSADMTELDIFVSQ